MRLNRIKTVLLVLIAAIAMGGLYRAVLRWDSAHAHSGGAEPEDLTAVAGLMELSDHSPESVRFSEDGLRTIGLQIVDVKFAPPPEPLKLPGTVLLDPNHVVCIHSRFPGELVMLGTVPAGEHQPSRQLRFGDRVERGQIIASVWSKDIGEKKSELVDAISKIAMDKTLLGKLEAVPKGVVPEPRLQEARYNYESDLVAVAKAERTLRSWRMTEDEIEDVRREAQRIHDRAPADPRDGQTWAETEVRAPMSGIVVEKNFNVGDLIDTNQDLFKIADLSRVQVLANAYEEDLPMLRALRPDQRRWQIDVKSDPNDVPLTGSFDTIGSIIDPTQHSGTVMGWVDNTDGRFKIGQFITAAIELPADPGMVVVPISAVIEDGESTRVWVLTNAERREFTCRKVAVIQREQALAYIRAEPTAAERANGAEPLRTGSQIIKSGVLELLEELRGLQAAKRVAVRAKPPTSILR